MLRNKLLSKTFTWTAVLTIFISIPATAQSVSPVAPQAAQVKAAVNSAYSMFKGDTSGKNADYIPYLAQVNPKLFGIAVVTTDNQVYTLGDISYSFSIQSISKVFTLALAMAEIGPDKVFERIGSEPTGRPFNSVEAVVDMRTHTGNPLVNAGAIATTSLISGQSATIFDRHSCFAERTQRSANALAKVVNCTAW